MTRPADLSDLTGRKCMSPGCRNPADHVVKSTDRRGRTIRILKCAPCHEQINRQLFAGYSLKRKSNAELRGRPLADGPA